MRPIAVGIVTKKAPFAIPFSAAKITKGPIEYDTGHIDSILTAFTAIVNRSILVGPNLSQAKPAPNRPTAVQALKPATIPAPVEAESPMERAKRGRKNGGTKSANVPMAPARNRQQNGMRLKSDISTKEARLDGACSLMSKAAGIPLAREKNPMIRIAQGIPTLSISA